MNALRKSLNLDKYPITGVVSHPPYKWLPAPEKSYRKVRRYNFIDTVVIHATAGGSSAGAMSVAYAGKASWHALIPDENEIEHGKYIFRCVQDDSAAWHVLSSVKHPVDGKININDRSLGIEIVNAQIGPKDPFSEWQIKATAQLVAHWRSVHKIKYLYTHAFLDPGRKLDPGDIFDWEKFVKYIEKYLSTQEQEEHKWKLIYAPDNKEIDANLEVKDTARADIRPVLEAAGLKVVFDGKNKTIYYG